ncbi:MAG: hypothetical protein AAF399_21320 [Bacteroidota bacterium]
MLEHDLKGPLIDRALELFWEFTEADWLDKWEDKVEDVKIVEQLLGEGDPHAKVLADMSTHILWIGRGNLYGGTGEYSKWTLDSTMDIYQLSRQVLANPPELDLFTFSEFIERGGWGHAFSREQHSILL